MAEHFVLRKKDLFVEATGALARLDADRLEELARSCAALDSELIPADPMRHEALGLESIDLRRELTIFARVLEATRANLCVLRRVSGFRSSAIEYGCGPERTWAVMENSHGHN